MDIKINKEFRDYSETIYFGMNMRQLVFSAAAVGVAVGAYFLLRKQLGIETLSWLCILCAAPFAALGFITYNGMTAEQFLWAWIKTEILIPRKLVFKAECKTYTENKDKIRKCEKEVYKKSENFEGSH